MPVNSATSPLLPNFQILGGTLYLTYNNANFHQLLLGKIDAYDVRKYGSLDIINVAISI